MEELPSGKQIVQVKKVPDQRESNEWWHHDLRTIIPILATDDEEEIGESVEYYPDFGESKNQMFSPCNVLTASCIIGHVNVQLVSRDAMGLNAYISKYMQKGIGGQVQSLPLWQDAADKLKKYPTTGEQLQNSSTGEAASLLIRALNSHMKVAEFSTVQMLTGLLGNEQYQSSHAYNNVWIWSALEVYNEIFKIDVDIIEDMESYEVDFSGPMEAVSFFMDVEDGDGVKLTAKSQCYDYMHRGAEFKCFNFLEYMCAVKKVSRDYAGKTYFEYSSNHQEASTKVQVLKVRQGIPILCGNTPPIHPGEPQDSDTWRRKARRYAHYFLVLLCPWSAQQPVQVPLSYEGFNQWMSR
ncbi:hypothetical protein HDU76_008773, partial [Blyttiomyces sp. JEL0837]